MSAAVPGEERRAQLETAYRATHYRVDAAAGAFTLRVGQYSRALAALYQHHGLHQAVFLSACNPGSRLESETVNQAASAALRRQLQAAGNPWIEGYAIDPEGKWPEEHSFLVLGMDVATASALGRQYGQLAFLYAGPKAIPEIHWLVGK